jgi:xylulokinase
VSVKLGLDVGTSGARAVAVDSGDEILAYTTSEYTLSSPHPSWSEQDQEDWWEACLTELAKKH